MSSGCLLVRCLHALRVSVPGVLSCIYVSPTAGDAVLLRQLSRRFCRQMKHDHTRKLVSVGLEYDGRLLSMQQQRKQPGASINGGQGRERESATPSRDVDLWKKVPVVIVHWLLQRCTGLLLHRLAADGGNLDCAGMPDVPRLLCAATALTMSSVTDTLIHTQRLRDRWHAVWRRNYCW